MPFATIPEAVEHFRAGRMLVVVDDEDRENEGDLTVAAELTTPEIINFMAVHGRGLICLALAPDLTVAENIFLEDLGQGRSIVDWKALNKKAGELLKAFGYDIDFKSAFA